MSNPKNRLVALSAQVSTKPPQLELTALDVFLSTFPPGRIAFTDEVRDTGVWDDDSQANEIQLKLPDIKLECPSPDCQGVRPFFRTMDRPEAITSSNFFAIYHCRNCRVTVKTFAISWVRIGMTDTWQIEKYGESPAFGPSTPTKLLTLLADERDYFLKGRRCESQGLGIAAFAYYRRVVENRKTALINEIAKVARTLGKVDLADELEKAATRTSFSSAVEEIKHGVPESLLINGHNPLTLLHGPLSEGLHGRSDDECLAMAANVRIVLVNLVERLQAALQDDQALNQAVTSLMARRTPVPSDRSADKP